MASLFICLPEEIQDKIFNLLDSDNFLKLFELSRAIHEHLGHSAYFQKRYRLQILGGWFESERRDFNVFLMKRSFSRMTISRPLTCMIDTLLKRKRRGYDHIVKLEFSSPSDLSPREVAIFLNMHRDSLQELKIHFMDEKHSPDDNLLGNFDQLKYMELQSSAMEAADIITRHAKNIETVRYSNLSKTLVFRQKRGEKRKMMM